MEKKKKCFVCNTLYHLLITLIQVKQDDIIFIDDRIKQANHYQKNIQEAFECQTYVFNDKAIFSSFQKLIFNQPHFAYEAILNQTNAIILFNDLTYFGFYLQKNKIYYTLFEDGFDCYRSTLQFPLSLKTKFKNWIKGVPNRMGESKYCTSIYVHSTKGLNKDSRFAKFKIQCRNTLFTSLSEAKKQKLLQVFNVIAVDLEENACLILTQPLFYDGLLESEQAQLQFYQTIIHEYLEKEFVVYLKEHPRDQMDYAKHFPMVKFLNKNVPMELIDFVVSKPFEEGFTHSSTALNALQNVNKRRIYLNNSMEDKNE